MTLEELRIYSSNLVARYERGDAEIHAAAYEAAIATLDLLEHLAEIDRRLDVILETEKEHLALIKLCNDLVVHKTFTCRGCGLTQKIQE